MHFAVHEYRSLFVPLVCVLLVNRIMMLLRIFAAFQQEQDYAMELVVGVVGVVDMSG